MWVPFPCECPTSGKAGTRPAPTSGEIEKPDVRGVPPRQLTNNIFKLRAGLATYYTVARIGMHPIAVSSRMTFCISKKAHEQGLCFWFLKHSKRYMKTWGLLLLAFLSISCTQTTVQQPQSQTQAKVELKNQTSKTDEIKQPPVNPIPMPQIQTLETGVVWRQSKKQDETGNYLPPWNEIEIANISFKKEPVVGKRVTVIPLQANLDPLDVKILKTQKQENSCDQRLPAYWEIDLEPIEQKEFFEIETTPNRRAEYPFDVAIVYPAVKFARALKKEQLTSDMLPKGVAVNTVFAAIDMTNDQRPDMVIVRYCCTDSKKSPEECSTCSATYRRASNSWELIDSSSPC